MIGVHIIFFFSIGCTNLKTSYWLRLNSLLSFRIAVIRYAGGGGVEWNELLGLLPYPGQIIWGVGEGTKKGQPK